MYCIAVQVLANTIDILFALFVLYSSSSVDFLHSILLLIPCLVHVVFYQRLSAEPIFVQVDPVLSWVC